jgi:hypothetical protein
MAFIELGTDAELFAEDLESDGYVANQTRLFAHRPAVYRAWEQLLGAVKANIVEGLRAHGLSDTDILDVALAAGARCFYSTVLDATGVEPDAAYRDLLEADLRQALAVGRPIAAS